MQAAQLDGLLLDPLTLFQNCLSSSEGDINRCEVSQALMAAVMIIMVDKYRDLIFQIGGKEVIFQQSPVLERLMPRSPLASQPYTRIAMRQRQETGLENI